PSNVIVTNGGTQAILTAQAHLKLFAESRNGKANLHCITPTWLKLPINQAKILGIPYDEVPLVFKDGLWTIPPLPQFFGDPADVQIVFAVNTGNPTGQVYESSKLRAPNAYTILDITYESMWFEGGHLNVSDMAPYAESTFIVGSLSKTFAIPGV